MVTGTLSVGDRPVQKAVLTKVGRKWSTAGLPKGGAGTLYEQVAKRIETLIRKGVLQPGQRIPSVRALSKKLSVSMATVLEAYRLLDNQGLIESRPQSGHYVRWRMANLRDWRADHLRLPPEPGKTATGAPSTLDVCGLAVDVFSESEGLVPSPYATPWPELLPLERLGRMLARAAQDPSLGRSYDTIQGYESLRVQIAQRASKAGCSLTPADIVTTAGARQAVVFGLRATTRPGDIVAVETPTGHGLLQALEMLQLRALEIATDPREGICLTALRKAIGEERISACALAPTFGDPLGHCMSDERKQQLVRLLAAADIPLIEDDTRGELGFGGPRPKVARAFDNEGRVLLCSSFSRTIAPGYRVGWLAPGRYRATVERLKFASGIATSTPAQVAMAEYLAQGSFDRHLLRLRRTSEDLVRRMASMVARHFPAGTKITRPSGGHVLWVEMPAQSDSLVMYEAAKQVGVGFAPGPLFSATGRFRNCMRLNCSVAWSYRIEEAVELLGGLARRSC